MARQNFNASIMAFLYMKALLMFLNSNFNMKPYILLSSLFLMAESHNFPTEEGPIDYYINLIRTSINKISQYELPTNAYMHKPQDNVIQDYGTYDFIIVGSGLSGSVLANRLSETDKWRVLLIEAGNFTDGGLLKIPGFLPYHKNSTYNWGYKSVPQKNFCLDNPNQQCSLDRGKGVGGGSLINAMVYCRGPAENYNSLAQLVNDSSWNYQNMMPYFKKTESFRRTNPNALVDMRYHGQYGLLQVQHGTPDIDYTQPFFDANEELGYKIVDYNGPSMLGASHLQHTLRYGNREDFGSIFISPFFGRQSLDVTTGSYVIKVEINNGTKNAESVLFTKGGTTYRAKASKEIILSSGTIASPQILMLSGIGPKKHLTEHGIPVIENLEVGSRYKDDLVLTLPFSSTLKFHQTSLRDQLSDYFQGKGYLSVPSAIPHNVGFYQASGTKTNTGVPDTELFPLIIENYTFLLENPSSEIHDSSVTLQGIGYFNTKSIGSLRLKSNCPYDYPLINPNSFSDKNNEDLEGLYQSVQLLFKLMNTKSYKKINSTIIRSDIPACANFPPDSRNYWYCYFKHMADPGLHMIGTCAMGTDPNEGAVVDANLKVFGIKNLRVVDASIFPNLIAGHTAIPCTTIAEKMSDDIKKYYGEPVFSY